MAANKTFTPEELLPGVNSYEEVALNAHKEEMVSETPFIVKYQGVRKSKLVSIVTDKNFADVLKGILGKVLTILASDATLSENVEVFTSCVISDNLRTEFGSMFMKSGLSITILDRIQLESINEFQPLFSGEDDTVDYDSSLFDYLSMSNETMDVKNSIYYALLLMMIYKNQPVTKDELEKLMHEKYGKNAGDVTLALKDLKKQKKVSKNLGPGATISLTDEEKVRLEQSIKEEKAQESDFLLGYEAIIKEYGVTEGDTILELLKEAYQAQSFWHTQTDDDEKKKEEDGRNHFEKIRTFVSKQIGDKTQLFIKDLRALCDRSEYLSRYSLSRSFLQLYRSASYEKYISNKESCIVLDTPVATNYLCYLSGMDEESETEWENVDYQSVKSLTRIMEGSKGKIFFTIPYDYLQETVGELKKALQFSWFSKIDLAIKFETGNTFYNFYQHVKEIRVERGQDVKNMSFADFAKELGFTEVNPDAALFGKKAYAWLKYIFEKSGVETIDIIKDRFEEFDNVKETYEYYLHELDRRKTMVAVNSDVRQALFFANETTYDNCGEINYFLTTWDKTLRKLRDIVNEEKSLMSSYSVMKPSNLASKLAFKNFSLQGRNVSEDVFAYADSGYNLTAKVQSLFDNVLTPYFANANNHNSALVVTMLKMEKDCQDTESREDVRPRDSTILADIFLPIVYALPDNGLSSQNLREFLADESNNEFVINLFQEAFQVYAKGEKLDISERFCEKMRENLTKGVEDIKL